jgi:gluconolactonase
MLVDRRESGGLAEIVSREAEFEVIADGFVLTEGIAWHPRDHYLVFSEIPSSTIYKWSREAGLSVLRRPSNLTNGNTFDRQGRLLCCEHATSCVSRLEEGGRYFKVLASRYEGKELNSPNDIIVDSRDRIWFTDPTYGRTRPRVGVIRDQEIPYQGVYRLDPDGGLTLLADDFLQPNGLCLTPDETALLVNDTDRQHIRRFSIQSDGSLSGGEILAEIRGEGEGKPDGMKVDVDGRIYCTGPGGVHVLAPSGELLGVIETPDHTRNFCFGGEEWRDLFFATSSAILRLRTRVKGIPPPLQR